MAKMMIDFLHHYHNRRGYSLKDKLIAYLPRYGPLASRFPRTANAVQRMGKRAFGFSARRSLHDTHRSSVSNISSDVKASGPNCPDSARRSVFARPRVTCFSSPVARNDGHIVPASNLRQCPLLLHISTAAANPVLAAPGTLHSLQSSTASNFGTA